jgi:hypothetical protein
MTKLSKAFLRRSLIFKYIWRMRLLSTRNSVLSTSLLLLHSVPKCNSSISPLNFSKTSYFSLFKNFLLKKHFFFLKKQVLGVLWNRCLKKQRRQRTYILAKNFGILKRYEEYRKKKKNMEIEICQFFKKKIKVKFWRIWEERWKEKEEKRKEEEEWKIIQDNERRLIIQNRIKCKTLKKWLQIYKNRNLMRKYIEIWRGENEYSLKFKIFEAWKNVIEEDELWKEQKLSKRKAENHWRTSLKVKVFLKLKLNFNRKAAFQNFIPLLKVFFSFSLKKFILINRKE